MRGASPRATQELAGHTDLQTTQRYVHLAPAALRDAIGLLYLTQPHGTYVAPAVGASEKRNNISNVRDDPTGN